MKIVTQQSDKTWQHGQAAATLLVAYMFVLQGLVVGFAMGGAFARAPGEAVCFSTRAAPASGKPAGPNRGSHNEDACCVQHCSGLDEGVVAGFVEPAPPAGALAGVLTPLPASRIGPYRGALPLGARAPPLLAA